MGIRLFHVTSTADTEAILKDGFQDGHSHYLTDSEWEGVWLIDNPDLRPDFDADQVVLQVDLELDESELIHEYEWVGERKPYREFLLPAELVNRLGKVQIAPSLGPTASEEG